MNFLCQLVVVYAVGNKEDKGWNNKADVSKVNAYVRQRYRTQVSNGADKSFGTGL